MPAEAVHLTNVAPAPQQNRTVESYAIKEEHFGNKTAEASATEDEDDMLDIAEDPIGNKFANKVVEVLKIDKRRGSKFD
jgi:hypothetical protein